MIYRLDKLPEDNSNPITGEKHMDDSWIIFTLTDSLDFRQMCGGCTGCAYTIETSRLKCKDWEMAVGDFLSFCEANGLNAILVMAESDLETAKKRYEGHQYNEPFLRGDEPPVLIHSTPMENWKQIQRDGMLKSWNILKSEKGIAEEQPIGACLGDPVDFRNYIMFGSGVTGEIIVKSKQLGKITMNTGAEYLTGARLYFDAQRIAKDGLLIRDGCHIKVKDTLPLNPYLIWAATWETIGLSSQISTPRNFAERADRQFQSIFQPKIETSSGG